MDYYKLGANYCRTNLKNGGVCIFTQKDLKFTKFNLNKYCTEQTIEVCAVKLNINLLNICILSIYRAPGGNFIKFLHQLDSILRVLHSANTELIICGDINPLKTKHICFI
jgi:exonuclease III